MEIPESITDCLPRAALAGASILLVSGCVAVAPAEAPLAAPAGPDPAPFSAARAGEAYPAGWTSVRLARRKPLTQFQLVEDEGRTVMRAVAEASASVLRYATVADPREYPVLRWRWKVPALIDGADNADASAEDSPARVIVTFEGGRDELAPAEQMNYDMLLAVTGHRLPYATLMYIWENRLPEGTVIPHGFSSRIKMIVAGSGAQNLGVWHEERHNVLEDYRRAFGEEPPRVNAVSIMSDADNTGRRATAYFGDIRFEK